MHLKRAIRLIGQSDLLDLCTPKPRKYRKPKIKWEIDFGNLDQYDLEELYNFALYNIGGPVPQFEPYILESLEDPYDFIYTPIKYAKNVIKGRWPEYEERLLNRAKAGNKEYWDLYEYALDVIGDRWPEAEPFIMKDPEYAYYYATEILKRPWPEAEPYIKKSSYYWDKYQEELGLEN